MIHCHRGCTLQQICAALGLTVAELYPEHANGHGHRCAVVATYQYATDKRLVYEVLRYAPKALRQRRPTPGGTRWLWNERGRQVQRVGLATDKHIGGHGPEEDHARDFLQGQELLTQARSRGHVGDQARVKLGAQLEPNRPVHERVLRASGNSGSLRLHVAEVYSRRAAR